VRTAFNLLGPLTNPAGARRQLLGVFARDRVETVARVLAALGADHAWVVHGADGLDEITTTTTTFVAEIRGGEVRSFELDPRELGVARAEAGDLVGGSAEDNAMKMRAVLSGELGALSDIVALNAGAAIYIAGRAPSLREGVETAREILASGAALAKLEALKSFR
jgi:anthranilate phosphoribosyltransferase